MRIDIVGKILRDKEDVNRRNYESFVISMYHKFEHSEFSRHVLVNNYMISARGVKHKTIVEWFDDAEDARDACAKKCKEKLARDRVEYKKVHDIHEFEMDVSFVDSFTAVLVNNFRLTIGQAKAIAIEIATKFATEKMKEDAITSKATTREEYFEEKIRQELTEPIIEKSFGKNAKDNPLWGLF